MTMQPSISMLYLYDSYLQEVRPVLKWIEKGE